MRKAAASVIMIGFGISLAFTHFVHNPPTWVNRVAINTGGERVLEFAGHRVRIGFDVERVDDGEVLVPMPSLRWLHGDPVPGCASTGATLTVHPSLVWSQSNAPASDSGVRRGER